MTEEAAIRETAGADGAMSATARSAARYRRGALLVAGAALAWSSAGVIMRSASTDPWTTLFWRSTFATLFFLAYMATDRRAALAAFRRMGWPGLAAAGSFAVSTACFIHALGQTSVANVLVCLATIPLFGAALAWAWLGERIVLRTVLAGLATILGVAVMVSGSVGEGRLLGDLLAIGTALSAAVTMVVVRRYQDVPMVATACVTSALAALFAFPLASLDLAWGDLGLMVLFGIVQMGLGLVMFMAGSRLMPPADAGLITVIETALAPLWVWLVFGEDPGERALAGGVIVVAAVIANGLLEMRAARRR